jgi:hypothetical protein
LTAAAQQGRLSLIQPGSPLAQLPLHAAIELGEGHGLPSGEKLEILTKKKEKLRLATAKKELMRPAMAREAGEVPTTQSGEINDVPCLVNEKGHAKKKPRVEVHEWPINSKLTTEQKSQLTELFDEFQDGCAFDTSELGVMEGETFRIPLTDETPIFKQQYRLSQAEKEIMCKQMEERKAVGFIRASTSEWAAPVTMPPKKDENRNWTLKRPCVDYRGINKVSLTDHYPLPTPEDIFDELADSDLFTSPDLKMGYHQIRIAEEDCCKTAFWCLDGLHEWTVVPFGLKNAPSFL